MIKNTYGLEYVKDNYREKEQDILAKMYPGVDTEGKYVLFAQSELWFPYLNESIKVNIDFVYEDGIKNYKNKLRRPYPNKTITIISMANGRRVCDLGIPILFDSFEELEKLKSVLIKWEIDILNSEDVPEKLYVQVLYDVSFKYVEGKRIYGIYTKDTILESYKDEASLNRYLEQFSNVALVGSKDEGFFIKYYKGTENNEELMCEEAFLTVMNTMGLTNFIETTINNSEFSIYSYYKRETLNPNTIAEDLPHH